MSANNSSGPVVNNNKKNDKQVDTHQAAQQHGTGVAANASQTQHAPGKLQQPAGHFDLAHRHKHADGTADDDKSIAHQAAPSGDDQASTAGADAGAPVASADGSAGSAGADAAASLGGTPDGSSDSGAAGGAAPAASSGVPTAVWVGLGALAIGGVAAGIALSGGHSDSSHDSGSGTNNSSGNKGTTLTGNVEDGLVAGAHIYIDVNGNGIPVAAGDTGVVTDASGHYSFTTTLTGAIIAVGGTNIDTGLPNTITLSAPAGSTVINPLTTLVQSYAAQNHVTTSVAEAAVAQGLGISSSVSLTTYDPYSAASGDTTALAVQKLAAEVATILTVAQSSAAQASGGTAESAVLSALTNLLSNSSGTVDLSQQATINALNQAAGGVLNVAEVQNILTANQAIGAATTLDTSSGNSVSHAQSANLSVQDETVAGAQTLLASNASAKYNLIDTAANLAAASATLGSHAVNVTVTSTATVAQAAVIHAFGNTGTTSYTITDTAANVLAGGATVSAATTVTVTDAFVTVAQASALAGLNAHVAIAAIHDTEANLLAAINSHAAALGDTSSFATTDAASLALSVHDAQTLLNAHVTITHGYSIVDTGVAINAAVANGASAILGASALTTSDNTALALSLANAHTLHTDGITITHGYALNDTAQALTSAIAANDSAVLGATALTSSDSAAVVVDVAHLDSLGNAHITVTHGITLHDSASAILGAIENEDANLANAQTIATTDASAVTLSIGDEHALATANVTITHGYAISDTEQALLDAINGSDSAVAHATSLSTNDVDAVSISVDDANTLANAHVTITHGYVLNDANDALEAVIADPTSVAYGATALTTTDDSTLSLNVAQANTLLGTDGIVITNGFTIADTAAALSAALVDPDSPLYGANLITVTDDQPLTFTIAEIPTIMAHTGLFAEDTTYSLADTAGNLYAALNGDQGDFFSQVLQQAVTITTTDDATLALTIAQADGLTLANITNGYTIADTEANLLAAIRSCDPSLDGAQGLATTDADAVTLSVHDADRLAHAGVTITNGYTLADGAWALAHAIEHGDAVVAGAQSLSTTDASAVSLTVQAADALTGAGVDIVAGYNLSDRAANLLAAITSEDPVLGNAGAISTSDHSAITLTIANEHTLAANHVTITNGYNLSDDASVLLNAFTNEDAALTNAIAISTDDASDVTLSVDEANTLLGHSVTISNGYTLLDSEANLLAAINQGDNSAILGASGYATNDDGAVSLDLTDADTLLNAGVLITNGYTLSGSEADLLAAITSDDIAITSHPVSISTTDDGAVTLSLGDADTLLNAGVSITDGYVLTGTASAIDAAIASNDIAITSNVTAITTSCDRQLVLSVAQADTLLNDGVTITNGYALHDTADHLLAALAHGNDPAILGTGSVEVTDQNLVLNVSDATTLYNDGVSYAHGYVLADNASALYNAIENNNAVIGRAGGVTANDAAGAQLSVNEVDTLLDANVSFANSYTLFDSAANLADAILSDDPAVLGASTYVANDTSAATLSVQQADTLIGSNVALAHGYNLVDGSVELADAIINNDAAFSELTGSMTTNDSAALTVQQADALLNHSVTLSDGYSISDTAQNLLDAINDNDLSITSNPTSITTQDSGSLTLGVEQADTLLNHGVTIAHGFTLVDSADDLLAAIAIHGDLAIGEAGSITDNDGTDLVLNATQAEALVHAGVTFENSFTLAGSLSDIEGALSAIGTQLTAAHATIEITDDNLVIPFADVAGLTAAGVQLPASYSVSGGTWDLLNAINGNNAIVSNASALVVNDGPMGLSLLQIDTLTSHNVTFQLGYGVWDTAQHILSAINGDTFGQYSDATSFATSDSNPVSLSVLGTDTLLDHGVTISHGVNLTDDASNLLAAIDNGDESLAHATAITTDDSSILTLSVNEANVALTHATITHGFDLYDTGVHIADALIAGGAAVGDAFTISATDATGLTVAEADALIGANIQYSGNLTLADSLGNLELAILTVDLTALQAATSITVTDAETGSLSVSDAHALLQYNVSFQAGYDLVDSSQNLLDAAAGDSTDQAALLGASAIEANDSTLATLTVTQATTLEGLHVTFAHGYAVADTADNFYNAIQTNAFGMDGVFSGVQSIATTDDGPITLGVTEADALLEHGVTITNAFDLAGTATELLAADIDTLTDARSITADDVDGVTLDAADAATLGHYNVSYEYGLTIDDSAANWVAALEGSNAADLHAAILSADATIETNDDGPVTLDVADAKVLVDNGVLVTDGLVVQDSAQAIAELLTTDGAFLTTSTIVSFVANDSSVVTLSVADVNVLAGASITIQHGYVLADTASALLDVIGNPMVSGARSVEVTDADPVLSVSDAESLLGIGATYERGYTLTGSATDLVAALTGDPALLVSLTGVETTDTGVVTLSLADAQTLMNAHVSFVAGYAIADSADALLTAIANGTIGGFDTAPASVATNDGSVDDLSVTQVQTLQGADVTITHGYHLVDTVAELAGAPSLIEDSVNGYSLSDGGSTLAGITVSELHVAQGADNFGDYTYSLTDSLENFEGALDGDIAGATGGYSLSDIAGSTFGNLTVSDAQLLTNASNYASNNYHYTVTDSLADIEAAASIAHNAQSYTLTDSNGTNFGNLSVANAELLTGASNFASGGYSFGIEDTFGDLLTNPGLLGLAQGGFYDTDAPGHMYGPLTVEQVQLLEQATNYQSATYEYSLTDSLSNLAAAPGIVAHALGYSLNNAAGNVGTLSAANASIVAGASNHASYSYAIQDSATDIGMVASTAVQGATGVTVTGTSTVTDATAVLALNSNTQVQTLQDTAAHIVANSGALSSHVGELIVVDPASVAQAVTINNIAVSAGREYAVVDSAANLSTGLYNWTTFSGVTSVTVLLSASTDLSRITLDTGVTSVSLNGQAVRMTDAELISLQLSGTGSIAEVLSANRDLTSVYNSTNVYALASLVTAVDLNGHNATLTSSELTLLGNGLTDSIGTGSVSEVLTGNISGALSNFVKSLDLNGYTATLSSTQLAGVTVSANTAGSIVEQLASSLDLTSSLDSHVTQINLEGHTVKLTDQELAAVTVSDSIGGGTIIEQLTGNVDLTHATLNSLIKTIDLDGHTATVTSAELSSLTFTDTSVAQSGALDVVLSGTLDFTSSLNSFVKAIDLNGHSLKLTDTELASSLSLSDSSATHSGSVTEEFTNTTDLTSGSLNSHVHVLDLDGNAVTLTDSELNQVNYVNDTASGGTLSEQVTQSQANGSIVSLVNHSSALTFNLNLNNEVGTNATVTIAGLQHNDTLNVGSGTGSLTQVSVGTTLSANEYSFDTSSKTLTWDDNSGSIHAVVLANATNVALQQDQHTFKVI